MKKITSIEHALEVLGQQIAFDKMPDALRSLGFPERDLIPKVDISKIEKIIEGNNVLNGNWKADWNNSRQGKYCVWQYVKKMIDKPSGFGFADSLYDLWLTHTHVGERLLVGSAEEAIYIGTDFIELFESAWLIIPEK